MSKQRVSMIGALLWFLLYSPELSGQSCNTEINPPMTDNWCFGKIKIVRVTTDPSDARPCYQFMLTCDCGNTDCSYGGVDRAGILNSKYTFFWEIGDHHTSTAPSPVFCFHDSMLTSMKVKVTVGGIKDTDDDPECGGHDDGTRGCVNLHPGGEELMSQAAMKEYTFSLSCPMTASAGKMATSGIASLSDLSEDLNETHYGNSALPQVGLEVMQSPKAGFRCRYRLHVFGFDSLNAGFVARFPKSIGGHYVSMDYNRSAPVDEDSLKMGIHARSSNSVFEMKDWWYVYFNSVQDSAHHQVVFDLMINEDLMPPTEEYPGDIVSFGVEYLWLQGTPRFASSEFSPGLDQPDDRFFSALFSGTTLGQVSSVGRNGNIGASGSGGFDWDPESGQWINGANGDPVSRETWTSATGTQPKLIDSGFVSSTEGIVSSWDPNDMTVYPAGPVWPGTELVYKIRFENTGNAPTGFVEIRDTLRDRPGHTWFDLSSFYFLGAEIEGTSVPAYVSPLAQIVQDSIVVFQLNQTNLAPGAKGSVSFNIRTSTMFGPQDKIGNEAAIRFVNAGGMAFITNTAWNWLAEECESSFEIPRWLIILVAALLLLLLILMLYFLVRWRRCRRMNP